MAADDLHVNILIADIRMDLIGNAHGCKCGHCGYEGNQARLRHTGGDTEHILLRNADVEETLRELLTEYADLRGTGKVSCQSDNFGMLFSEIAHCLSVVFCSRHRFRADCCINKSSCHGYFASFSTRSMRFL